MQVTKVLSLIILSLIGASLGAMDTKTLFDAAKEGDVEQIKYRLAHGAHVRARDLLGQTALHIAAFKGHKGVCVTLLFHALLKEVPHFNKEKLDWLLNLLCCFNRLNIPYFILFMILASDDDLSWKAIEATQNMPTIKAGLKKAATIIGLSRVIELVNAKSYEKLHGLCTMHCADRRITPYRFAEAGYHMTFDFQDPKTPGFAFQSEVDDKVTQLKELLILLDPTQLEESLPDVIKKWLQE